MAKRKYKETDVVVKDISKNKSGAAQSGPGKRPPGCSKNVFRTILDRGAHSCRLQAR